MSDRDSGLEEDQQDWLEWHPTMMNCDATMLCVAPRGQGKTTFMLDASRKGGTQRGMVVCPTPELYKTYAERFPMLYCHAQFDQRLEEQIDNILQFHEVKSLEIHSEWKRIVAEMQEEAKIMRLESWRARMAKLEDKRQRHGWSRETIKRKVKRAEQEQRAEDERCKRERETEYNRILNEMRLEYSWTCIWDDLAYDKQAMNSKSIAKSVKNGRHYIQKQFYACQAVRDFKCSNRDQIDLLAMSPLVTLSNIRRFMDDFIPSGFRKPAEFIAVLTTFAKHRWWLVINRRTSSLDPKDFIYRYRAEHEMISSGYIGCPGYIFLNQLLYDPVRAKHTIAKTKLKMEEVQKVKDSDDGGKRGKGGKKGQYADDSDDDDRGGDARDDLSGDREPRRKQKKKIVKKERPGLFETIGPYKEMLAIQQSEETRRNRAGVNASGKANVDDSGSDSSDDDASDGGNEKARTNDRRRRDVPDSRGAPSRSSYHDNTAAVRGGKQVNYDSNRPRHDSTRQSGKRFETHSNVAPPLRATIETMSESY